MPFAFASAARGRAFICPFAGSAWVPLDEKGPRTRGAVVGVDDGEVVVVILVEVVVDDKVVEG